MSCNPPGDLEAAPARSEGTPVVSPSVRSLGERLRDHRLAWGVLAPSCLARGAEILEMGRAIREELSKLSPSDPVQEGLERATVGLDRLGDAICGLAFEVPISQLRSTLPGFLRSDRRGLLALLDLLAVHAFENAATLGPRLDTVDYVITLLCTGGDSQGRLMPHDPVQLTPRLQEICRRADSECDPELARAEAEFFAAANLGEDLRNEVQLRSLRARKAELGRSYFATRMLRAIVTYNVALLQCVAAEVQETRDWGSGVEPETPAPTRGSVFECDAMRSLHEAVRRRLGGGHPETSAIGRVAWALDLDYANGIERSLLRQGPPLSPDHVQGVIVLLGLLSRSLSVLAVELQSMGIDPDAVWEIWVKELDDRLKTEVNALVSGDAYREACGLSELRHKFLYEPIFESNAESPRPRPRPSAAPGAAPSAREKREVRQEAKELAGEALAQNSGPEARRRHDARAWWSDRSWRQLVPTGLAVLVVAVLGLHQIGVIDLLNRGLDGYSGRELERLSPHLAQGHRNGEGAGRAFVGTLDEDWLTLGQRERRAAAERLVTGLRAQGVSQVMVYDEDGRLRIQALGKKLRVL